jgi:hypothetical protein
MEVRKFKVQLASKPSGQPDMATWKTLSVDAIRKHVDPCPAEQSEELMRLT